MYHKKGAQDSTFAKICESFTKGADLHRICVEAQSFVEPCLIDIYYV